MEPTTQNISYSYPLYIFIGFILCIIVLAISVSTGFHCGTPNCDLIPEFFALFFALPGILTLGLITVISFIRRKRQGLFISKTHRYTALTVIFSPLWIPVFAYILSMALTFGVFNLRKFAPDYVQPVQMRSI